MIKGIYAHRGYHDKPSIPENSIPAFKRAIDRGFGAELDVHLIKDGSLVVFHDSELKRITGIDGILEDLTQEEVKKLRLEGTDETIPTFDEVLDLFEDTTSLIIELKTYKGNYKQLVSSVCQRLDSYKGTYCIESFDPRAVAEFRKQRPKTVLGFLVNDFFKEPYGKMSYFEKRCVTNLWYRPFVKPDFVACKFENRFLPAVQKAYTAGVQRVYWTITSKENLDISKEENAIPIFERFDPEA